MQIKKRILKGTQQALILAGLHVNARLADRLGMLVARRIKLDPSLNKRQVRDNLRLFFPDRDEAWVETTARDLQANVVRARVFDKYFLPRIPLEQLDRIVEFENLHFIDEARAAGRGTLCPSMHFGRFWACPIWLSRHGYEAGAFQSAEGKLPSQAETLSAGTFNANNPRATVSAVRSLRSGSSLFLILDAGKVANPVTAGFLGQQTYLSPAAVRLARASEALIVPVVVAPHPDDPDRIRVVFSEPIDPKLAPDDEPPETILQHILDWFEPFVLANPSNWFGIINAHRRMVRDDFDLGEMF